MMSLADAVCRCYRVPMRRPNAFIGMYMPLAISAVAASCGFPGDGVAPTQVGDTQDPSITSTTDCRPTRGVVGPRGTSYAPPATNVRYVSRLRGSPPPAHPNECIWGGPGNPFSTLREAI